LRVHVINLDRSPDRLAEFTAANGHLTELTRFPAIDGRSLDIPWLVRNGIVTEDIGTHYNVGAVGAALSHAALWERAIEQQQATTICEDDAILKKDFDRHAADVMQTLPPDWDFILWGFNFDLFLIFEMLPGVSHCLAQFEQDRMRASTAIFQEQKLIPHAFRLIWAFGIPCYTVSPAGAGALRSRLVPFRPLTLPCPEGMRAAPYMPYYRVLGVDGALNSVYRDLNAYLCFPPLAISKNEPAKSTIQTDTASG
jgi:glycosyl transferase family 25